MLSIYFWTLSLKFTEIVCQTRWKNVYSYWETVFLCSTFHKRSSGKLIRERAIANLDRALRELIYIFFLSSNKHDPLPTTRPPTTHPPTRFSLTRHNWSYQLRNNGIIVFLVEHLHNGLATLSPFFARIRFHLWHLHNHFPQSQSCRNLDAAPMIFLYHKRNLLR